MFDSRLQDEIRRKAYYDIHGNMLTNFSSVNQICSGITSGVTAGTLNLLSGLSAQASQLNYATSYPASCAYAISAGTLSGLTATVGQLNTLLYGSSLMKYAIGSVLASNGMIYSHGLTSALYCVVNPQTAGVITGGCVSGTSMTFYIQADAGIFFTATSATVDFIVFAAG